MSRKLQFAVLFAAAAAALIVGWRVFWFLTDDAFIAFRYVANGYGGHGYVWNPAPFLPVEGYTSFLWVALLDGIWRLTGLEPPLTANPLALLFALLTLALTLDLVARMQLRQNLERFRLPLAALVLAGVVSNRTFLAWSSSGLETAMFNFWMALWVWSLVRERRGGLTLPAAAAALVYLTRPDGLLFAAATLAAAAQRGRPFSPRRAAALSPLLAVPIHLLWRFGFYGEWLPNTYYAKFVEPWPAAGARYLLSFVLEYALWAWIALLVLWLGRWLRQRRGDRLSWRSPALVVAATLAAHAFYYTAIIGGDHFEYRVYSHLIPLLWVGALWLLNALAWRPATALAALAAALLLAQPLPWTHWARSRGFTTRAATEAMKVPVAGAFPPPFRAYAALFDRTQFWLIDRWIGMRHQEHKIFYREQTRLYPSREEGMRIPAEGLPVAWVGTVGVVGWVLPTVNLIDSLGLNDWVIARTPVVERGRRLMAHDRTPPPGYLEAFAPNVFIEADRGLVVYPRRQPLTAEAVRRIESEWRERVRASELPPG